jgi:hypothetical protein
VLQAAAEATGGPAELDLATTLASFPPDVRQEVLMTADEEMLAQLPPAILAEAQALRTRAMRPPRVSQTAVRGGLRTPVEAAVRWDPALPTFQAVFPCPARPSLAPSLAMYYGAWKVGRRMTRARMQHEAVGRINSPLVHPCGEAVVG